MANRNVDKEIRRRTIISFSVFIIVALLGFLGWRQLYKGTKEPKGTTAGLQAPLRKVLNANETVFRAFSNGNLTKTYPKSMAAKKVRVNGKLGMSVNFDPSKWKLRVVKKPGDTLLLTLADIKKLPKTEIIFDFKCVEGWSQISHWGGVKFSTFMKHYGLNAQSHLGYVGFVTPDKGYYVGIDMQSALHDQTLLAYEMNDAPLPDDQGYPLRLMIPIKYGIKSLKRIGTISFSDQRPKDYWAEQGYDYYSGL
ncbi:MAG: molybdopterin-binding oxidoreductase [Pedobacter sp.]|nr:MAG: molybdopterin-binding oxidoreductase [Pedobacter sp.]